MYQFRNCDCLTSKMNTFRADRPRNRGGFSGGKHDFVLLHRVYTGFRPHPVSSSVYWGLFPGLNAAGVWCLTSPKIRSAECVKSCLRSLTCIYGIILNSIKEHGVTFRTINTCVPPYPRVIRSKTYSGYVKTRIIPNAIYSITWYLCNKHKYGKV
jgi:hypothetical protein